MKPFLLLFLLLLPPNLASAASPSLECEPDAKVTFLSRWFRGSVVRFEGGPNWEFRWTGREPLVRGSQIRADRLLEMSSTEEAEADQLLATVPEETKFVVFRDPAHEQNPLPRVLYVDRELLQGHEADGLVLAVHLQELLINAGATSSTVKVFHCRSR